MSDIRIVVAQRGWNLVGRYTATDTEITLADAQVIRRWGTTRGLGELVNGPLGPTILDPAGTVRIHPLAVVMTIDCDVSKWNALLGGGQK